MAHQRRPPFTKRLLLVAALAALASIMPISFATAQAPAPAAVSLGAAQFKGITTPGSTFDVVQSVIDFSPGAKSSAFTATTAQYLLATEADLTADIDGKSETIAAGKGIAAPAGAKVTLSNASTGTKARLFVSTLVGVGAVADVHQLSSAGVTVFATSRLTMRGGPAVVDITISGGRYDVGYKTAVHIMNQPHLIVLTEGVTGFHYADGLSETFRPGAQAEMYVGKTGYMNNAGTVKSAFMVTWVGAPGVPLTIAPPAAPAPPNTGTGLAEGSGLPSSGTFAAVLAGAGAAALGSLRLRAIAGSRRRRAR